MKQKSLLALVVLALVGAWCLPMVGSTVGLAFKMQSQGTLSPTYSGLVASGWLVNMLGLGVFGWISDRELRKTGSRTKLLLLSALTLIPSGFAFSGVSTETDLVVTWLLYQVPSSALIAVTMAIAGDKLENRTFGVASGLIGASPTLGLLLGLIASTTLGANDFALFSVPALAAVVLSIPLATYYPTYAQSKGQPQETPSSGEKRYTLGQLVAAVAATGTAAATMQIYPITYVTLILKESSDWLANQGEIFIIVASVCSLTGNLLAGSIIKSLREAKIAFAFGAIVQTLGLLLLCTPEASNLYAVAYSIGGLGIGASLGSSISLALFSFGRRHNIGRSLGVINAALTLPYILIPGLAGTLFAETANGLLGLFLCTAVISLASVPILYLKQANAEAQKP
ncbi:MAG: MFS transporter [Micrococcales bacterium]